KIISVAMLCKGFLAAAGTKTPGQKIWFYSIRVPKAVQNIF
ncbi:MAG: hypothetical protein ACI819_002824, partial [Neolewinella sp.]